MRYLVTYKFEGRYLTEVDANSIEEALALASDNYLDANFGEAKYIDGEPIIVEDEQDNIVWEK